MRTLRFLLAAALLPLAALAQPTGTSSTGPVQKVITAGAAVNDLLGPFNVTGNSTVTVKAGGLLSVAGTVSGNGTINLGNATVTLPTTVAGGTSSFQPRAANLDAWSALAPSTKADTTALAAHVADTANPHATTAAQVGLGALTNDAQVKRTEMGAASGVATLDGSGKVPSTQLASIPNTSLGNSSITIGSTSVALGGTASTITGLATPTQATDAATKGYTDTTAASTLSSANAHSDVHAARTDNPHATTAAQVGLGALTNDAQVKRTEMGAASGVATLDVSGKVPSAQLASIPNTSLGNSSITIGSTSVALGGTASTITGLATPTQATDAATKGYVDAAIYGLDWKQSVRAATTANITLSGAQTIDGVSVVAGDRVLVKNQTTGSQNGIYVAASGAWSRSADGASLDTGATIFASEGTVNGRCAYTLTTADPIVVGTTSLTFTQITGPNLYTSGTGINITGNQISTTAIPNSSLGNSTVSIAGTSVALGGSISLDTITGLSATGIVYRSSANTLAPVTVSSGLTFATGTLTANVATVAGRTGNVTLAQADVSGLTTASSPTFSGLTVSGGNVTGTTFVRLNANGGTNYLNFDSGGSGTGDRVYTSGDLTLAANGLKTIYLVTNGTVRGTVDASGLSVTGALAATGNLTVSGTGTSSFAGAVTVGATSGALTATNDFYHGSGGTKGFWNDTGLFGPATGNFIIRAGNDSGSTIIAGNSSGSHVTISNVGNLTTAGSITAGGNIASVQSGTVTRLLSVQSAALDGTIRNAQLALVNGSATFGGTNDRSFYLENAATNTSADFYLKFWNGSTATTLMSLSSAGNLTASGTVTVTSAAPATASSTGTAGTITWDSSYIYVCVATNTWKRAALSTW